MTGWARRLEKARGVVGVNVQPEVRHVGRFEMWAHALRDVLVVNELGESLGDNIDDAHTYRSVTMLPACGKLCRLSCGARDIGNYMSEVKRDARTVRDA